MEAIVEAAAHSAIRTDGPCIDEYLKFVAERMGDTARSATQKAAVDIVSKCVAAYEAASWKGEVGAHGSGRAKGAKPLPRDSDISGTTGLLYGKVQSGKTNAAMATVGMALANGFRVFIVLTSDNLLLGTQTADRFAGLAFGPTIYQWREWQAEPAEFGRRIAREERFDDTGVRPNSPWTQC